MSDIDPGVEAWVEARVPALLRYAYLVTGSRDGAEEAVQNALAAAVEKWDLVSASDDPERYLRRMIANAHISAWRKWGRRESPVPEVRPRDYQVDPATGVGERDAVWRVCQALPTRQRAVVVLRFYEDLDYPEIAATLGITEATVRSQIHRALAALRAELTRQENDDAQDV